MSDLHDLTGFPPDEIARLAHLDPKLYAQMRFRVDGRELERERTECEDSLLAFFIRAWREIDAAELQVNWHHELICEYLEDICYGRLRNIVINIPPRCTKSLLSNVIFPAFCWAQPPSRIGPISGPQVSFLCVSYGATLAEELAVKMRRLVMGAWYQSHWGDRVRILDDQQSRANFGTVAGGERISASVEGGLLGRGGNCLDGSTRIITEHGEQRIDEIANGAKSFPKWGLSFDAEAGKPVFRPLIAGARRRSSDIWRVYITKGHFLQVTADHLFYVATRGWVETRFLTPGDAVLRIDRPVDLVYASGYAEVVEARRFDRAEEQDVFDLQVEGTHCFFANGILVHNCQILDDVISPGEANSALERDRVMRAISEGLATRVRNPRTAARIMVMQRLHMADPTSYALTKWSPRPVHLMLPMRYEPDRSIPEDPRTYPGELLWPSQWDEAEVAKTEIELGDYGTAAQFAQSPIPREGGIISPDDWQIWPEWTPRVEDFLHGPEGTDVMFVPLPPVSHVLVSLDTAMSEKESADYSACVVLGIWHRPRHLTQIVGQQDNIDDGEQPRVIVMGAWRARCKLNDEGLGRDGQPLGLVQRVIATARRFGADRILIEHATRGLDVKNEIERQMVDTPFQVQLFNPRRHGDKVARLHAIQPLFSQGLVYAPANCRLRQDEAGTEYVDLKEFAWVRWIMDEVSSVPKGENDDGSDAMAQGLLTLRDEGYLALTREYIANEMRRRLHRGRRTNIREGYGV